MLGLASAFVPYCTVPFERSVRRRGLLDGPWRLGPGGDAPSSVPERVLATALRHPGLAAVVVVAILAVVFVLLLVAGPPTQWGS